MFFVVYSQLAYKITTNIWNTQGFNGKSEIYLIF